jgi:hypothetical protein
VIISTALSNVAKNFDPFNPSKCPLLVSSKSMRILLLMYELGSFRLNSNFNVSSDLYVLWPIRLAI